MTRQTVRDAVEYHLQALEDELLAQLSSGESTLKEITQIIEDVNLLYEFEDDLYNMQTERDMSDG